MAGHSTDLREARKTVEDVSRVDHDEVVPHLVTDWVKRMVNREPWLESATDGIGDFPPPPFRRLTDDELAMHALRLRNWLDKALDALEDEDQRLKVELALIGSTGSGPAAGPPALDSLTLSAPDPRQLASGTLVLEIGIPVQLKATAVPTGKTGEDWTRKVRWSSTHPRIRVDDGEVLANGVARGVLRARTWDGLHVAQIDVDVIRPEISMTRTADPMEIPAGKTADVRFSYVLENTGTVPLEDIKIADPQCAGAFSSTGRSSLDPGQTDTWFCTATAVAAPLNSTATASGAYRLLVTRRTATTASILIALGPERDPPDLNITTPAPFEVVTGEDVVVTGTVTDGGRGDSGISLIYVNNEAIVVDRPIGAAAIPLTGAGADVVNWSFTLKVLPGQTKIKVEAYDGSVNRNRAERNVDVIYKPPVDPALASLTITPDTLTLAPGETAAFTATALYMDGTTKDVTTDVDATWTASNPFTAASPGSHDVTVIFGGKMASATVTVSGVPPPPPDTCDPSPGGPPGGLFNILFRPDGTGRDNCFAFMVARVGSRYLDSQGVLTPAATREGWSVDTACGDGPYDGSSWADPKTVNARMMELSVYGGDAYGCREPARFAPPTIGAGQVSPIPPGMPAYGIWRRNRVGFPANCFEFVSAPIESAPKYDGKSGYVREPNYFGPWAKIDVSKITSQLSPYESDEYGCFRDPDVVALAIAPASSSVAIGQEVTLVALATMSDGSLRDVTNEARWSAALPWSSPVAGSFGVWAKHSGIEAEATIEVAEPTAVSLAIFHPGLVLAPGEGASFRAEATMSDGSTRDVTTEAIWSPADHFTAPALPAGAASETHTLSAVYLGLTASVDVEVRLPAAAAPAPALTITSVVIAGATGSAPIEGNALVGSVVFDANFDGMAAVKCRRQSDGHDGGGLQLIGVSSGSNSVDCLFPAMSRTGHPVNDQVFFEVSDGDKASDSRTGLFAWQRGDTFGGMNVSDAKSGKSAGPFRIGATLEVATQWALQTFGATSRDILYLANGVEFHRETVTTGTSANLAHGPVSLALNPKLRGRVRLEVRLFHPDGSRQIGETTVRTIDVKDKIVAAAVTTGQAGSVVNGVPATQTVFVPVTIELGEDLEGTRRLVLTRDDGAVLGRDAFQSKGGTTANRAFSFDTRGWTIGRHTLSVRLVDPGGNKDRELIDFRVKEPALMPAARRTGGLPDQICQDGHIHIRVYDYASKDDDIISVAVDGVTVATLNLNQCKSAPCMVHELQLPPGGRSSLAVFAHNEGSSPPNTAQLQVDGACNPGGGKWRLKTGESAAIFISRP